jgi:L-fucono-1,5-lactonase
MRIDAHVHFWRYRPEEYEWIDARMGALQRDFLPDELDPLASRAGFDGVVAVQARHAWTETAWLLELAARHPLIRGVVGWVDLRATDVRAALARAAAHEGLVGVRHIAQDEPDDRFLVGPEFLRGIEALAAFDLAYDILVYPRHLPVALELVRRFPAQRFVLDHLAKPDLRTGALAEWARDLRALAACPNVMAKLSGLVTEADWSAWRAEQIRPCLDVAFECFGPGRLLIGSDWPVCTLAGDYGRVMGLVTESLAHFSASEREAVLGGNAVRFWRLDEVGESRQEEHER